MPEQVWPAFANAPQTPPETALPRLASAQTICGSLPPSSRTVPFIRWAACSPTRRPTSTEPVKKILPAVDSTSAPPTAPPPWTVWMIPSGRPACSNTSWIFWPIRAVSDAGFSTTPLPHISAIAISPSGMLHG